ncbi:MAG: glutathione S-transferase family protein [Planctomycetota bacterium]
MSERALFVYPGSQGLPSLSPPAAKVVLAVARAQIPCEVVPIGPEQVKRYSPTGRVPALRDGAAVHVDSVRILDHLETVPGARALAPRDPLERVRDRLWEHLANDTLYWCVVISRWLVPQNLERMLDGIAGEGPSLRRWATRAIGARTARKRAEGQGMGLKPYAEVVADWRRGCAMAADALGKGPFLEGRSEPGRGDLALATLLSQVGWRDATPELDAALREHPPLREHARRTYEACGKTPPAWLA